MDKTDRAGQTAVNSVPEGGMGALYVVATPIGNLGDISPRAAAVLEEVDVIAAEDTRRTLQLLNYLGIKNTLISYYRHNEDVKIDYVLSLLRDGKNVGIVSDAGTPGISDPGEPLIAAAAKEGITVTVIPGAAAVIAAVVLSGLPTARFAFDGFLPMNKKNRKARLEEIVRERRTVVLYEAPHKLIYTLEDLKKFFGGDRRIALCRELTKLHEEIIRTTIDGAVEKYKNEPPKGEFVLVIEGCPEQSDEGEKIWSDDEIFEAYIGYAAEGMTGKEAVKAVAKECGRQSRDVYALVLKKREDQE